jgi:hypothetical protein
VKVTTKPPEPVKPNIVIELTWGEAMDFYAEMDSYLPLTDDVDVSAAVAREFERIQKLIEK